MAGVSKLMVFIGYSGEWSKKLKDTIRNTAPLSEFDAHPQGEVILKSMNEIFMDLMDELQYRGFVQPLCGWDDDGISISWLERDTGLENPYQIKILDTTIKLRVHGGIRRANGTKDSTVSTFSAPYDIEDIANRLQTEVFKVNGRLNT